MSDNATPTCDHGDGIELVSGTNIGASQTPYMGQWMAHWLQTCRNSSSKDYQLHSDARTGNIVHQFEGHDCLALDRVKSKEFKAFKLVREDMNQRYSLGRKGKSNSAAEDAPLSDTLRSSETSEVDREKLEISENSSIVRNVEPINDETTFSEKGVTQHLTESSIKWKNSGSYCCHNLYISKLNFEHFPMLDINRKIETILASKKKSNFGAAVSVKMVKENLSLFRTIDTSSLLEFAPGSCLGDAKKMMATYNGFLPDNAEDMDGASFPVIRRCKYRKTNTVMFSSGLTYVDPMNNKLTSMRHSRHSCCSSSKPITTGIKTSTGSVGNLWTSLKGKSNHLVTESNPTDFPYSFSIGGHGSEVKGDSSRRLLPNQRRLSNPDDADMNLLPCKMPKCSKHDMNIPESCQNFKSVDIGERFHKFSSTIKYLLIADKVDTYQCLSERTMGDSAFTLANGRTFKTLMIPTKQDIDKKEKSAVTLENILIDENRNCCDGIGVHLIAENNEFSTEDDTLYNHPFHESSPLLGKSFSRPQKGVILSNLKNSKPSSSLSPEVASRNPETRMAEKREVENPASTDKAVYPRHKEASVSSTDSSLATDHIVSHVKLSIVSSSSPPPNHTSESKTCNRWIKRLQDNHSESLSLCSKRFKKSEEQQTFNRVQNHNPLSYCSLGFMKEHGKCKNSMALTENVLPSGDSDESVQLWLRRWCRNGDEKSQITSSPNMQLKLQTENLSVPLEKFEGNMSSASIGAMALMAKAMNNYRPCKFRREEGSLVWNTEE